jgi:hypothetical protein
MTALESRIPELVAEIKKLRAQLADAGLPDANDFPAPESGDTGVEEEDAGGPYHRFGGPL